MSLDYQQLAESFLTNGKGFKIRVNGGSMSPILRTGDMVYIGPVKAEALTVGNIALFKRGREMVAHRLIDKTMSSGQVFPLDQG